MNLQTFVPILIAGAFSAAGASTLAGQTPVAPAAVESVSVAEDLMREARRLHRRLEEIQRTALDDPEITSAQEELGSQIKAAMERIDPTLERGMERLQAMAAEVAVAEQKGATKRVEELTAEAQEIEMQFQAARDRAFAAPEIAAGIERFQERLQARMLAIDPDTERLLSRLREVEERIAAAVARD